MTQIQLADQDQAVKTAARLMSQHLKAAGFDVSQGLALETLAASFGLANWRTLKAKLTASSKKIKVEGPRYDVLACYTDNNQMYGDRVDASCPLAAAIYVQLERFTDAGSITEVQVMEVIDRTTKECVLSPSYSYELDLVPMPEALARVCGLARLSLGQPPSRGIAEAEEWDKKNHSIAFWERIAEDAAYKALLVDCIREDSFDFLRRYGNAVSNAAATLLTARGDAVDVDVLASLDLVLALAAEQEKSPGWDNSDPKASGRFHLLQVREVRQFHEDRLTALFNDIEVVEA